MIGPRLAVGEPVAELLLTVHGVLGAPPADSELQPSSREQIGRGGLLGEVERVLVAQIQHPGADVDAGGDGGHGGQQRHRRRVGLLEVVDAHPCPVQAYLVGDPGEVDVLAQRRGGVGHAGAHHVAVMPEGEEPDALHASG